MNDPQPEPEPEGERGQKARRPAVSDPMDNRLTFRLEARNRRFGGELVRNAAKLLLVVAVILAIALWAGLLQL